MEGKNLIIDNTIRLLEIGRNLPTFTIRYLIRAKNEEIIRYIALHTDDEDDAGKPITLKEFKEYQQQRIDSFLNGPRYEKNGYSNMVFSKTITVSDIGFDMVRKIMYEPEIGIFLKFLWEFDETKIYYGNE